LDSDVDLRGVLWTSKNTTTDPGCNILQQCGGNYIKAIEMWQNSVLHKGTASGSSFVVD
jgi:hypothetical protein